MKQYIICVDFDGTIVDHRYPAIGQEIPGAISTLLDLQAMGHKLILWTMRSGGTLTDAVNYLEARGVNLYGINKNPSQHTWTESPKAYGQIYIDDAALGCPLKENPRLGGRPYVDWKAVRQVLFSYPGILQPIKDGAI